MDQHCDSFTTAPILAHWEPNLPLVVETDTSDYALAAIISMHTLEGKLHPITFHSRTFTGAKLNYDVHNKELMAILKLSSIGDTILRAPPHQ